MAEGLHLWRCHHLPVGRAADVLGAPSRGVSKFSEQKSRGFNCQCTLGFGQAPRDACFGEGQGVWGLQAGPAQGYTRRRSSGQPRAFGAIAWYSPTGTFIPSGMVVDFKFWVYFSFYPEESDGSTLREILIVNY